MKNLNWKLYTKFFITALAVGWIINQVNLKEVAHYLSAIPLSILISSFLVFNVSKFLGAFRLNIFFRLDGILLSKKENLKLYYKGMFYNFLLPGGIGGDGYKGYYLHNALKVPVKNVARPILWDRVTGTIGICLLVFTLLNFQPLFHDHPALKILAACSPVLLYLCCWIISNFFVPMYRRFYHSTTMLAVSIQLIQCFIVILLLLGMHVPVSKWDDYVLIFLISSLVTILPITVGGVGIREFIFLKASEFTSVEQHTAVAFTLVFLTITLVSSLIGSILKIHIQRSSTSEEMEPQLD